MDLSYAVFQEPRGIMRILQLFFAVLTLGALVTYSGSSDIQCANLNYSLTFSYPFNINKNISLNPLNRDCNPHLTIDGQFGADAGFFFASSLTAVLVSIVVCVLYAKYDNVYKTNTRLPIADFVLTVIIAVLWLSSSAAWANGLSGLKHLTSPSNVMSSLSNVANCMCKVHTSSYSSLNISIVLGFLNFFLWAVDLWFLYKETVWFHGNQRVSTSGL